jgi:hypothetical protein
MPNRRQTAIALAFAPFAALAAQPLWAAPVVVEGKRFEDRLELFGRPLVLNGTGVRAVAWFKGYAAGLYLGSPTALPAAALGMEGPKRLRMHMLQEVPAAEFTKAFDKGVARNTPAAELPALAQRMQQFDRLIAGVGKVRKGDVIDLDLDPQRGLAFSLNGKLRGEPIPGADLYAALLRTFIGEHPYDDKLKAGLLGAPAKSP